MNGMIVYIEKLMKSTKKLLECHFIKVVVYKFNIKKNNCISKYQQQKNFAEHEFINNAIYDSMKNRKQVKYTIKDV